MESDFKRRSQSSAGIACKTLTPTETPMGSLGSGQHALLCTIGFLLQLNRIPGQEDGFCTQELEPSSLWLRAWPIFPKHRARRWRGCRFKRSGHRLTGYRFKGNSCSVSPSRDKLNGCRCW
jgi:hypothetical protein